VVAGASESKKEKTADLSQPLCSCRLARIGWFLYWGLLGFSS
jgi:hypothetical protein